MERTIKLQKVLSYVRRALDDYNMIEEGDKIAVCISGGKDSMLLAKLMQEIQKHKKVNKKARFAKKKAGLESCFTNKTKSKYV